jgi:hypothetical protein
VPKLYRQAQISYNKIGKSGKPTPAVAKENLLVHVNRDRPHYRSAAIQSLSINTCLTGAALLNCSVLDNVPSSSLLLGHAIGNSPLQFHSLQILCFQLPNLYLSCVVRNTLRHNPIPCELPPSSLEYRASGSPKVPIFTKARQFTRHIIGCNCP